MVTAEEFKAKIESWGIPASDFIDDVGKYLSEKYKGDGPEVGTDSAEAALRKLDELLQKYKMFEAGLAEKVKYFNPFKIMMPINWSCPFLLILSKIHMQIIGRHCKKG